ncbi:MAG: SprB repeat-containing protein [Crocinitomicaceae bacterium]|nr:SprB repeat-containing protein [Crocinitomicaceae bacterium]
MMKIKLVVTALTLASCGISNAQFWKYSDPVKLGGTVNTDAEESIPVFSKDSSILYFVRTFDADNKGGLNDQDIWYSVKNDRGGYDKCARLKSLNNKFNNAVLGVNSKGTAMYVLNAYDGKKDVVKGIAVSNGSGTSWGAPEKMAVDGLDIEGDFYGFHVSEDEKVMLISYAGSGSLGEEDLYYSINEGGNWSKPKHMGNAINSAGFEISPFLSQTKDTLFFSSNGFGGQGDADIFYSVKQNAWDQWSTPKNLGSTINSPKFDAYFMHSGSQAYWSSNRDGDKSDIYLIDIMTPPPIVIECNGTDVTTYNGEDGKIDLTVVSGAEPYSYKWSNGLSIEDPSGLKTGEYSVEVTDVVGQVATSKIFIGQPAKPIEEVIASDYENLSFKHNFGYNKNKLSVSRGRLKKFVKSVEAQLKDGRDQVTISITSSASQVPTKSFGTNEKLAEVRAENMKYDLIAYFKKKYADKVNIVVASSSVQGPAYLNDSNAKDKYEPFQFVSLITE